MTDNLMIERVLVPFTQSMVTGVISGVATGCAAVVWHLGTPLAWGGLTGAGVCLMSWLYFRSESMSHQEVLQPARIMPMETQTVRFELAQYDSAGFGGLDWMNSPLPLPKVIAIAKAWKDLRDPYHFSISRLGGRGKLATRSEVETVRDFLISKEFAGRANGAANSQTVMTWQGRRLLEAISELDPDNPVAPTHRAQALLKNLISATESRTHTDAQMRLERIN